MSVLFSRRLPVFSYCCLLVVVVATLGAAQKPPAVQIQDEEFARLVKEWTTKPEFSSPLVDHLPKSTTIPSPKDVLGNHMGEPKKMLYYADALKYYRAVAAKTPRVKVLTIGKTHEGRENVIVLVGSDESMRNLEQYRLYLGQLADPRNLTYAQAQAIIAKAKPIYHMIGGLHSPESAAPLMFLELVYRLVVEDSPIINQIRDNVIVSITPSGEPDGMDRFADWVYAHRMGETSDTDPSVGSPPYWGKYTYHDNNRDINVSQPNMKNLLDWYLQWHPPIVHDLHQSVQFLYTYSGQAPQNPTFDPIIFGEMPWIANFEMAQMTKYGMPGVWTHAFMDAFGIGYFASLSPTHNGLLRMYETFGNGSANTLMRNVAEGSYGGGREWYRPVPAGTYGTVDYSMRNSINYAETAVLSALQLTAAFPKVIVENFYLKSRNSIETGKKDAPFGYVIPGGQRDATRVAFVIGLLRNQGIEVGRATSEVRLKEGTFPAGSFIVKRDQPYGRLVKMMLEKQIYPDPKLQTYDDSGWTVGLMTQTDIKEIADKSILDVAVQPVSEHKAVGTVAGASGSVMAVAHYGSNYMVSLRYRLKDLKVQAVEQAFQAEGLNFPAGSFLIPLGQGTDAQARAKTAVEQLGLTAAVLASAPAGPSHDVDLPRLAVYSTWGNTQEVGWVRHALDEFGVTYDLIYKERVKAANLRGAYDVIIVPNQGRSGKGLVYDTAPIGRPIAYKKTEQFKNLGMYGESDDVTGGMGLQGAAEFQKFVEDGGVLATFAAASFFPPEFGITRTIEAARPSPSPVFYAPGPIVQAEILKPQHPIFYGYTENKIPVRYANGPLLTVPARDRSDQILMRFPGGEKSVMSGFMRNPDETLNRPAIVEVPTGRGRVLLFATNPCYRWQVWGEFNMMFNLVMNFNDIKPAGKAAAAELTAAR